MIIGYLPILNQFTITREFFNPSHWEVGFTCLFGEWGWLSKTTKRTLVNDVKSETFIDPSKHSTTEALGIVISQFLEWDINEIQKVTADAFEDANAHGYCNIVNNIEKVDDALKELVLLQKFLGSKDLEKQFEIYKNEQ